MGREAVLFVVVHPETSDVLMEQRSADSHRYPNQLLFPGGIIETAHHEGKRHALIREIKEELGVKPLHVVSLMSKDRPPLLGEQGDITLYPFLIDKWEGEIPDTVRDKGNQLVWRSLHEEPVLPTQQEIFKRIRTHLKPQFRAA